MGIKIDSASISGMSLITSSATDEEILAMREHNKSEAFGKVADIYRSIGQRVGQAELGNELASEVESIKFNEAELAARREMLAGVNDLNNSEYVAFVRKNAAESMKANELRAGRSATGTEFAIGSVFILTCAAMLAFGAYKL